MVLDLPIAPFLLIRKLTIFSLAVLLELLCRWRGERFIAHLHTWAVLSPDVVQARGSVGWKAMELTDPLCPMYFMRTLPVSTSHKHAVPSAIWEKSIQLVEPHSK